MEFIPLYCTIPHEGGKKQRYLMDVEAGVSVTIRCNCSQNHINGHSNRTEFVIDSFGVVVQREVENDNDRTYQNNVVRIGG